MTSGGGGGGDENSQQIISDDEEKNEKMFRLEKRKRSINSKLAMQNLKITRLKRPPLPFRIGGRLFSRYNSLIVEKP